MKQAHIWRNYYPKGAVDFFLAHHSEDNIMKDIERNRVFFALTDPGTLLVQLL